MLGIEPICGIITPYNRYYTFKDLLFKKDFGGGCAESFCSQGWSRSHQVDKDDLEFLIFLPTTHNYSHVHLVLRGIILFIFIFPFPCVCDVCAYLYEWAHMLCVCVYLCTCVHVCM